MSNGSSRRWEACEPMTYNGERWGEEGDSRETGINDAKKAKMEAGEAGRGRG